MGGPDRGEDGAGTRLKSAWIEGHPKPFAIMEVIALTEGGRLIPYQESMAGHGGPSLSPHRPPGRGRDPLVPVRPDRLSTTGASAPGLLGSSPVGFSLCRKDSRATQASRSTEMAGLNRPVAGEISASVWRGVRVAIRAQTGRHSAGGKGVGIANRKAGPFPFNRPPLDTFFSQEHGPLERWVRRRGIPAAPAASLQTPDIVGLISISRGSETLKFCVRPVHETNCRDSCTQSGLRTEGSPCPRGGCNVDECSP